MLSCGSKAAAYVLEEKENDLRSVRILGTLDKWPCVELINHKVAEQGCAGVKEVCLKATSW